MKANAMILHHPEAVNTNGAKVMGRHSAGEGFLKGFVRFADVERFYCYAPQVGHYRDFDQHVAAYSGRARKRTTWISPLQLGRTDLPDCLYVPGPGIDEVAWLRRRHDQRAFSVCGVTHTISTTRVMERLGALLTAPVQRWDALICTSRAVKAAVTGVLESYGTYLRRRLGANVRNIVELPVIPLGVDSAAFAESERSGSLRAEWRGRLGIADDDVAILFLGRLSFHAKAHPVPMYLGLQKAAKRSRRKLHLIQAGQFANAPIERQFREAARTLCPDVGAIYVDSRPAENRNGAWRAADIFVSLSDNIQESFGLTPIEAKAAGLPSVVSDWDGYRDTIRHGIDGFTIPTRLPRVPNGEDLAFAHRSEVDSYDRYIGHVSQCTAVDVDAIAEAMTRLADNAELRRRMGDAARRHARETFDWSVVIASYQELWSELAARRRTAQETAIRKADDSAMPLFDDPFAVFAHYATAPMVDSDIVAMNSSGDAEQLDKLLQFEMNRFASGYLVSRELYDNILRALHDYGPSTVGDLARLVPAFRRAALIRTIAWLGKMGLVRIGAGADVPVRKPEHVGEAAE